MANEVVAEVPCPMARFCPNCQQQLAEVRRGDKGRLYLVMEECTSNFRTMSGMGGRVMQAVLETGKPLAPPAPVPEVKPAPVPVPEVKPAPAKLKKKSNWTSVFGVEELSNEA